VFSHFLYQTHCCLGFMPQHGAYEAKLYFQFSTEELDSGLEAAN